MRTLYFCPVVYSSSFFFFFFSRLISAVAEWMSTIFLHMVWPSCEFRMQVWNVLHAARWKYKTQKWRKKLPSGHRHCSGRQPNFAALNTGCHLYSAGPPSRWTLVHILISVLFFLVPCGRLSRLFFRFWVHVNIRLVYRIVSYCKLNSNAVDDSESKWVKTIVTWVNGYIE